MNQYDLLATKIHNCQRCPLYEAQEGSPIEGQGNQKAKIMIVMESPTKNESLTGSMVLGRTGTLLNKMLNSADIKTEDVFVTNAVRCSGFKPQSMKDEVEACKEWLWKEIQLVQPEVIITMGKTPTYSLLNKQLKKAFTLKSVVGKEFEVEYTDAKVVPSYSLSYLMSHGRAKVVQCTKILKKYGG